MPLPAAQFLLSYAALSADRGNSRGFRSLDLAQHAADRFPDTIDLAFDKTELLQDGREEPLFLAAAVADIPEATRL